MKQPKTRRTLTRARLKRANGGIHITDRIDELIEKTPLSHPKSNIEFREKMRYRVAITKIIADEYKEKNMYKILGDKFKVSRSATYHYDNYVNYPDIQLLINKIR